VPFLDAFIYLPEHQQDDSDGKAEKKWFSFKKKYFPDYFL
jgi:hypothetical protein